MKLLNASAKHGLKVGLTTLSIKVLTNLLNHQIIFLDSRILINRTDIIDVNLYEDECRCSQVD